jgi:hypothetical protein
MMMEILMSSENTVTKDITVPATGDDVQLSKSDTETAKGIQAETATSRKVKRDGAAKGEGAAVAKLVKDISRLQKLECKSRLDGIYHQIAIGTALVKLKAKTKHGNWKNKRDSLGYDERTAQRLMKLSKSVLAKQIRDIDPDVRRWFPADLIKLDTLCQLSPAQLKKALEGWRGKFEEMDRKQLRDAVNGVLKPQDTVEADEPSTKASIAKQSKQTAGSKGKATAGSIPDEQGATTDVVQEEPTGQPCDSSDSGGEVVEPSTGLDSLLTLCDRINDADLKAGVMEEIANVTIDKAAASKAIKVLASAVATLKEIKTSLDGV